MSFTIWVSGEHSRVKPQQGTWVMSHFLGTWMFIFCTPEGGKQEPRFHQAPGDEGSPSHRARSRLWLSGSSLERASTLFPATLVPGPCVSALWT